MARYFLKHRDHFTFHYHKVSASYAATLVMVRVSFLPHKFAILGGQFLN